MAAAVEQSQKRLQGEQLDHRLGEACDAALSALLRETQVMTDWRADPALEDACEEVVAAVCPPQPGDGGAGVLPCLMEQLSLGSERMTSHCSQVLLQIHYFLAREVILDQALVGACGRDAEKVCKAEGNWQAVTEPHHKLVFPCLVRNLYIEDEDTEDEDAETDVNYEEGETPKLSDACTEEVERTLRH